MDIDKIISDLWLGKQVRESLIREITLKCQEIFAEEPNTVSLDLPITICGDLHGQIENLQELFKIGGELPYSNYLFLGDYVDRGKNSIETILILLCLKIKYPKRLTLLRGNHESRQTSYNYGFFLECSQKYNSSRNCFNYITDLFDYLPLSAVVDNQYFCVHGGLSPDIKEISQINEINRFQDIPHSGPMTDLLWSDPQGISFQFLLSYYDLESLEGWALSPRLAGFVFGEDTVDKFNHVNNISKIFRAHQLVMSGYLEQFGSKITTVWSCPNYCYRVGNLGSILEIDDSNNLQFKIFANHNEEDEENPSKHNRQSRIPEYFL